MLGQGLADARCSCRWLPEINVSGIAGAEPSGVGIIKYRHWGHSAYLGK